MEKLELLIQKIVEELSKLNQLGDAKNEMKHDGFVTTRSQEKFLGSLLDVSKSFTSEEKHVLATELKTPEAQAKFTQILEEKLKEKLVETRQITPENAKKEVANILFDVDIKSIFKGEKDYAVDAVHTKYEKEHAEIKTAFEQGAETLTQVRQAQGFQGTKDDLKLDDKRVGWTDPTIADVYLMDTKLHGKRKSEKAIEELHYVNPKFEKFGLTNLQDFSKAIYNEQNANKEFWDIAQAELARHYGTIKSVESGKNLEQIATMIVEHKNGQEWIERVLNTSSNIQAIGAETSQFSHGSKDILLDASLPKEKRIDLVKTELLGLAYNLGVTGADLVVTATLKDPKILEKPMETGWDELHIPKKYLNGTDVGLKTAQQHIENGQIDGRPAIEVLAETKVGALIRNMIRYEGREEAQGEILAVTKERIEVSFGENRSGSAYDLLEAGRKKLEVGAGFQEYGNKSLLQGVVNVEAQVNTTVKVTDPSGNITTNNQSFLQESSTPFQVNSSETHGFGYAYAKMPLKQFDLTKDLTLTPYGQLNVGASQKSYATYSDPLVNTIKEEPVTTQKDLPNGGKEVTITTKSLTTVEIPGTLHTTLTPTGAAYAGAELDYEAGKKISLNLNARAGGVYALHSDKMQFGEATAKLSETYQLNDKLKLGATQSYSAFFDPAGISPVNHLNVGGTVSHEGKKVDLFAEGGATVMPAINTTTPYFQAGVKIPFGKNKNDGHVAETRIEARKEEIQTIGTHEFQNISQEELQKVRELFDKAKQENTLVPKEPEVHELQKEKPKGFEK